MPALPPKIQNKKNAHRNDALTQRKNQLQAYLRQVLILLSERAPAPLLMFLNMHEQANIGFDSSESLKAIAYINLRGQPKVRIISNKITFIQYKPKVFFKLELQFKSHSCLPGEPDLGE